MKVVLKKVPVLGTAWQAATIVEIIWKTRDLTMDLVRQIEEVIDLFGQFLDAIADPEGQVGRTVDRYLAPFNNYLDMGRSASTLRRPRTSSRCWRRRRGVSPSARERNLGRTRDRPERHSRAQPRPGRNRTTGSIEASCGKHSHRGAARKTTVTVELLRRLAGSKYASPELRSFAISVATGDSSWDRIEVDAQPLPPEVSDMRADPMVIWPRHWPLPSDDEPYRIPWQ